MSTSGSRGVVFAVRGRKLGLLSEVSIGYKSLDTSVADSVKKAK